MPEGNTGRDTADNTLYANESICLPPPILTRLNLDLFRNISGLELNTTDTKGMWTGSSKEETKPFDIKWPNELIKALGVYFTYDLKLPKEKNFIERLDSIKRLINIWSSRGLSIYGKVMIFSYSKVCSYLLDTAHT